MATVRIVSSVMSVTRARAISTQVNSTVQLIALIAGYYLALIRWLIRESGRRVREVR